MIPFWMAHPRHALCDAGVWKCPQHPRMLWLASERRWAWRHRLRARRVARHTGWAPGELRTHIDREKRALCERLAADMAVLVARHWRSQEIRGMSPGLTLHTHGPETGCLGRATGCLSYPPTETVTTIFPPIRDTIGHLEGGGTPWADSYSGQGTVNLPIPATRGRVEWS